MARLGRPRKPLELKLADGTYRRDRDGLPSTSADAAQVPLPKPPTSLKKHGKLAWKRLGETFIALKLLTHNDYETFGLICETFDFEAELDKEISKLSSMFISNAKGDIVAHPAVRLRRECLRDRVKLMRLFGMSPSDRASTMKDLNPDAIVKKTVATRKRG